MGTIYIGRYKVIEELGRGGMGVVYRGEDPVLERQVAIKVLPPKKMNPKSIERFMREAKTAARLDSPYIVKIHDIGQVDDIHFIVMEYVEGSSLSDMIEYEVVPSVEQLKRRLKIFRQVMEAVRYAHDNGVIHRDLKPDNIMVSKAGQVKVMDFGLAFFAGHHSLTEVGQVMGTAAYVSPEQAVGKVTDERTDIYSLGVILFELITGRWPFTANNPLEMFRKVSEEPAPSPKIYNKSVTPLLESIVFRALRKKPEDRFLNMSEMIDSFDLFLNRESDSISSGNIPSIGRPAGAKAPAKKIPAPSSANLSVPKHPMLSVSDANLERQAHKSAELHIPAPSSKQAPAASAESPAQSPSPAPGLRGQASSVRPSSPLRAPRTAAAPQSRQRSGVVTIGGEAAFRTSVASYSAAQQSEPVRIPSEPPAPPRPVMPPPGPALRHAVNETCVAAPVSASASSPNAKPAAQTAVVSAPAAPSAPYSRGTVQVPAPPVPSAPAPEPVRIPTAPSEPDPEPVLSVPEPAAPVQIPVPSEADSVPDEDDEASGHRFVGGSGAAFASNAWMADVDEKDPASEEQSAVESVEVPAVDTERDSETILKSGMDFLDEARPEEALAEFDTLLARNPENWEAMLGRGRALMELGDFSSSCEQIEKAIQTAPESHVPYVALADFYSRTEQVPLVISALHKALDRNEYDAVLRCRLAFLYFEQSRPDLAFDQYCVALEQSRNDFNTNYQLGLLLTAQNRDADSFPCLERALAEQPGNGDICRLLVNVCLQMGRIPKAQAVIDGAIQAGAPADADMHTAMASVCIAQNNENQAVNELSTALEMESGHVDASLKLASLFCRHGQLTEAVKTLEQALSCHPSCISLHRQLGEVYILGGNLEKAFDPFEQIVKLDPACAENYSRLSSIALKKRYDAQSLEQYQKAVEAHPVNAACREDLAMAYYACGQYQPAIAEMNRACRLDYMNPEYPKNLGIMLLDLGAYEEAVRQLQVSLTICPSDGQARGMLGKALAGQGLGNLAIIEYQKAIESGPDMFLFNLPLARAYAAQGSREQAVLCFRRFLEIIPESTSVAMLHGAYLGVARSLYVQNEYSSAVEIYKSILQNDPYKTEALIGLARININKCRYDKASQYIDDAMKSAPRNAAVLILKADILGRQERWSNAAAVLQEAVNYDPHSSKAVEQLGRAYRKCGRFQDAVDVFTHAAENFPEMAAHFGWLKGRVLHRQGQYDAAVWAYRQALEYDQEAWRIYIDLGKAYTSLQQLDEAAQTYRAAERVAPPEEQKQIRSLLSRLRR